jgi:hypothetical protein
MDMKPPLNISFAVILGALVCVVAIYTAERFAGGAGFRAAGVPAAEVGESMRYTFDVPERIQEAGTMDESENPYWWLNSGGELIAGGGVGMTLFGESPVAYGWGRAYAVAQAVDTDGGTHPQNLFRLITRSTWDNASTEAYFKIGKVHMSMSPNRNASNGILLFSRYANGDNLYYAGIRVDGSVVIKKKQQGTYSTMNIREFYASGAPYDRNTNPNFIPGDTWIGLRMRTLTLPDGTVYIALYIDEGKTGAWVLALEAHDNGRTFGEPIRGAGHAGIRTDFMDVAFDDYRIDKL